MAKVFWDTNLFIYLLEKHPLFGEVVRDLRRRMLARGDQLYTSTLTVGEVLVRPLEMKDQALYARYLGFFRQPGVTVMPFDLKAATLYAGVRGDRTIKAPDTIQLACAAAAGADLFITNDTRLSEKVIPGIHFISSLDRAPI